MLASMDPIPAYGPADLATRMPTAARADLLLWTTITNASGYLGVVLGNEVKPSDLLPQNPKVRITDDQPYNEYFLLRKHGWW